MTIPSLARNLVWFLIFFIPTISIAQTSYNPFKTLGCDSKSQNFYLFYEGETIDFKYEKIGEVQSYAPLGTSNEILMDRIKYTAWRNCANGLILIKSGHAGTGSSDSETNPDLKYYTAIAVRIRDDEDFKAQYGNGVNMAFVQAVPQRQQQIRDNSRAVTAVCGIGLVILMILLISNLTF